MSGSVYYRKRQLREQRLDLVGKLYKKGWSVRNIQAEVKRRLGDDLKTYTHTTAWRDIQYLLGQWRESRIEDMDQALQLELERIDDAVRELWEEWKRSKIDFNKRSVKKKAAPKVKSRETGEGEKDKAAPQAVSIETSDTNIQMLGDVAYITEIRAQLMERRKLLGLYAPERRELTGKDGKDLNLSAVNVDLGDFTDEERQQLLRIARKIGDENE